MRLRKEHASSRRRLQVRRSDDTNCSLSGGVVSQCVATLSKLTPCESPVSKARNFGSECV
jgi:hypothetical protein